MVRQSNEMFGRRGWGGHRGGFRGRGRGIHGDIGLYPGGRGGIQKPPPLMSRPLFPPNNMRSDPHGHIRPPLHIPSMPMMSNYGRMGPPRMSPPGIRPRGGPNMRMGLRGHGSRPPLRGILPNPRPRPPGGLLPPPMPMPGPPGPMFRHRPPMHPGMLGPGPIIMRGRGMPGRIQRGGGGVPPRGRGMNVGQGGPNGRRGGKPVIRGRGSKTKNSNSPSRELNKPWVTEAMKNEILKKHKLHQKAKKARTKEDWHELWEVFKEHRNKVTTMLREAKLEYIGAHPEEHVLSHPISFKKSELTTVATLLNYLNIQR